MGAAEKIKPEKKKAHLQALGESAAGHVRSSLEQLGLSLPTHKFAEAKSKNWAQRLLSAFYEKIWLKAKSLSQQMTTRAVIFFFAAQIAAGTIVYNLEKVEGNKDHFQNWADGIWWGIVTITTTGYGDKFPATIPARFVAALLMCAGIVSTGIITGNIASWLVDRRLKEARGLINLAGKYGHLVICGWRDEMAQVLEEVFHLNPGLKAADVVIVAPITLETMEGFKQDERFSHVNIVRGDFFNEAILENASIRGAAKVLVLADLSKGAHSATEIDAKTVMTAMTIEKMAPSVYVAAELVDLRFESYLRLARVDEIIYSMEYPRILLANSSRSEGLAHVVYDLLNVHSPASVVTLPIPDEFIGKTYGELRQHFKKESGSLSLGLLENTGNLHDMKKQALKDAQKNPDTRTVLRNLKEVRNITTNLPVLNPSSKYVIKRNSMVVVVRRLKNEEAV